MNDLDMAFRLGFEQGGQQAQQDQMAQEQAQAQEIQAAAAGAQPGQPGEGAPGQEQPGAEGQPPSEHPEGSELDQHIAKLESMIAKPASDPKEMGQELGKSLEDLRKLAKSWKDKSDLRKSQAAIAGIAKALHKPAFKLSKQASINLNENAKQAVSMQHKIVSDVMAKMEAEEKRASKDIKAILADLTKE
ncbi:unnamed protein product [Sphagnum balticum]